jgi:hypothetical protein
MNTSTTAPIVSDLFGDALPDPFASSKAVAAPSAAKVPFETDDMTLAVALVCNGYGDPSLRVVGKTRNGDPKVKFEFEIPASQSARAIENKHLNNEFMAPVNRVYEVMRQLKIRISRLKSRAENRA